MDDEEEALLWQDVLDDIVAGRKSNLVCPFCKKGPITIEETPIKTRVECKSCRRFIEGRMTNADQNLVDSRVSSSTSSDQKK